MKKWLTLILLIPSLCWGLDKDELKEELKYWKSLLDDELISQEDYNRKKEELINLSIPSNQVSDKKQITQSSTNEQKNYYFNGYELNSNQIETIQTKLKSLGWDISVDGVLGNQTKKSIREWLECNNFKTSSFNDVSFNSLRETKKPCRAKFTTAQSETKSEDKKSLPSGYNAFVSHIQTPLCANRRYQSNCGTKLGLLKEGDYLKIVNIHVDNGKLKEFLVATEKLGVGFVSADHVEVPDKNFLKIKFGYTEINEKDLSHIYDAIVTGHNVKLCHSRYYEQCENYNVRKTLEKGDYLNIKDEKIIYGQSLVHVSTQNNNSGFVSKYDIKIFEPDKFSHSNSVSNKNNSKYDAVVDVDMVVLCVKRWRHCSGYDTDNPNKPIRKTIYKGEFLNILGNISEKNLIKVKDESGFIGYTTPYGIKMFNPEKQKIIELKNNTDSYQVKKSNTSNSVSNTSSSKSKCSGLNGEKSWVYKGLTGYFSKKDACLKIASYSDDELCSKIERGKDKTLNPYENKYKKEISTRGVACIDGIAFNKSDTSTKTLQVIKKLEDKIDNQPKYKEVCRYENVLGERLDGSTYPKKIKSCKNVRIKSQKELNSEALGGAIMSIFD